MFPLSVHGRDVAVMPPEGERPEGKTKVAVNDDDADGRERGR